MSDQWRGRLDFLSDRLLADVARSVMFVVVGLTVSIVREQVLRSERNLRETRDYLDSLIRYANAPIIVWDPEGRIARFNHAFEQLTGYAADEVIGQGLHILFPEASRDESLREIERTLSGGYWESVEIPILRQDGDIRLALWNSANIYAEDGTTLLATIAQGQDITEFKQKTAELERAAKEWQETFDAITDIVALISPDYELIRINRTGYEGLGKKPEELTGKKCYEVVHGLDAPIEGCPCQETIRTKTAEVGEITQGGRHYIATACPILDKNNELIAFAHTVKDITERKRAEEELRETSDYLENLINYANAPIIVWDPALRITRFNHAFEHLTGYTAGEVIGQELHILFPEASQDESLSKIQYTMEDGHWEWEEIPILRKDGDIRIALWNSANIYAEDGTTLLATIAQGTDITQRKRAEEALKEYSERLEEMVEERTRELRETQAQLIQAGKMAALGQLAGGVAHELNNPLTPVLIYAGRLLKKADDEALKDNEAFRDFPASLRLIKEAAIRCKTITDGLLTFSRQAKFEFAPLDVNQVIGNTLGLTGAQLRSQRITLIQELQPDLPSIIGNPNQLQQVFTNLIINAQHAMTEGGTLTIATSCVNNQFVKVRFTDTGCGIPEENQPRIFEPFFTTQPVGQGTGLGLSISYGIVDAHNGWIDVQSQVGVGSTFTVTLPVGEVRPCWEIRECAAEVREACPVYQKKIGHRCWTVEGTSCQVELGGGWLEACRRCEVYRMQSVPPRRGHRRPATG